jgi:hypothetical protein
MRKLLSVILLIACMTTGFGQGNKDVFVDKKGIMRYGDTKREVYGFGVNYTAPFAHAYRSARKLNVDLEKEIEQDVYHFARLGFDAYRVHVWDTEISDSVGNLLQNENLRLLDFLLARLKERGVKIILTPIAFWGNGYPDPDEKTPGFSHKYGKDACLVNEDAIKAQENYLYQFLNHVNQYTRVAYKDDPDILAFEVSNEPHHRGTPEAVKAYINRMVASMRKAGTKKPVFYNVSHSTHLSDAYYSSNIDGGTFQWYPTGLGAQHELRGNFLPNTDLYRIPFGNDPKFKSKAKIVYEFDAADVGRSYIYPAMARSFRSAGIQWATHFAYDPTFLAYANTEYNTHFMNLAYAPQKALSLMIASEVFHNIPMYADFGSYPKNTSFGDFKVSYEDDRAEYNSEKKFIYTNHTASNLKAPQLIEQIAGWGNSPAVQYEGTGAYFLDKVLPGIWRLEVFPDAIWLGNIFGRNSLEKQIAAVNWRTWPITINLPDISDDFSVEAINTETKSFAVDKKTFSVSPGVYLLKRKGVASEITSSTKIRNIGITEYAAPKGNLRNDLILHEPARQATAGKPLDIVAQVYTKDLPENVTLQLQTGRGSRTVDMRRTAAYTFHAQIPAEIVSKGFLTYAIVVQAGGEPKYFPTSTTNTLTSGINENTFSVPVVSEDDDIYIFNALTDAREVSREWRRGSQLLPMSSGSAVMRVQIDELFRKDVENPGGEVINDYSMRYNFAPKVLNRSLGPVRKVVIRAKANIDGLPLQITLIDSAGNTVGGLVTLGKTLSDSEVAISELKPVNMVTLPRPYPTFLPYFFSQRDALKFDLRKAETLQISIGPGLSPPGSNYQIDIENVRLVR